MQVYVWVSIAMRDEFSLPVKEEGPTDGDVALNGECHRGETGAREGDLWKEDKHCTISLFRNTEQKLAEQ